MCVSPAIGGVTIKARHMDDKDRFWSLASIVTTPLGTADPAEGYVAETAKYESESDLIIVNV